MINFMAKYFEYTYLTTGLMIICFGMYCQGKLTIISSAKIYTTYSSG